MKVIIPAAGEGTRLRPHTITKPKPILPIAGATIIDFIMYEISSIRDLEEVIFIVGYLKDQMIEYLNSKYKDIKLTFVEQKEYGGLAQAIYLTREYVKDNDKINEIFNSQAAKRRRLAENPKFRGSSARRQRQMKSNRSTTILRSTA